jgi:hypothetical protein
MTQPSGIQADGVSSQGCLSIGGKQSYEAFGATWPFQHKVNTSGA